MSSASRCSAATSTEPSVRASCSARWPAASLGDWFGWRNVFFILAGLFAIAGGAADRRTHLQSDHTCFKSALSPGRAA